MKRVATRLAGLCIGLMLGSALAASGQPDLQGYWVSETGPGGRGGPPREGGPPGFGPPPGMGPPRAGGPRRGGPPGGGARPQPSAAGIAAAQGYEQPYDDPAIKCDIANIIFGWTHDQNINQIRQSGDTLTLTYGYMDFVRTVHLNMAEHPKKLPLTRGGHSIGRWEGDTLVVDTVALAPSVLIPMQGIMLSDQAHIVERFTLEAGGKSLTRAYTVEDPLYLQQPFTGRDVVVASQEAYTPYECVELSGDNNKRSVR